MDMVTFSENMSLITISDVEQISPMCNGPLHEFSFKGKDGDSITLKGSRLIYFPQLSAARDSEK